MVIKILSKLKSLFLYPFQFKSFGKGSKIISPLRLDGKKNIEIGNNVYIQHQTWLLCEPLTDTQSPVLKIDDGCVIGHFNHICATHSIIFEENVLTADKVYISDNLHSFEDIGTPIHKQPIKQIGTVRIGEGSWLGENVCVIGANIGKHCTIGANSVVTHDIPDYSVAVGAPAKVIKRYNFETQKWEKVDC